MALSEQLKALIKEDGDYSNEELRALMDEEAKISEAAAYDDSDADEPLPSHVVAIRKGSLDAEAVSVDEAAKRIGMSRTHLYKLLDRGEIPFYLVGRDRRIRVRHLLEFEARRHESRRELAQRFANQQATRDAAIEEITWSDHEV